jgi:hypothetical protein
MNNTIIEHEVLEYIKYIDSIFRCNLNNVYNKFWGKYSETEITIALNSLFGKQIIKKDTCDFITVCNNNYISYISVLANENVVFKTKNKMKFVIKKSKQNVD